MAEKTITSAVEAYVQQTIRLVRSLVIKSELSVQRTNKSIISQYGEESVDLNDPRTWKYYMNIAGQYHFTDRPMEVISLDTQERIAFTVANMKIHTATAEAYKYGTRYFYSLVRLYPQQEQLIMAINNPGNIDKAIAAEDGDIITYYSDLIEPQEYTLVHDIERYIKNFLQRYQVVGFNLAWINYPTLNYSSLYQSLPAQIMNLRLEAIKTDRTHSFHITQYLASHGRLDRYMPYMTLKQKLYLYHNIDFIEKHAGFTDTFEELIQWILTDRYIPLSSYTIRQLKEFNEDLYPQLRAHRTNLGTDVNTVEAEYVPIESLYNKERVIQPGNQSYYEYYERNITHNLTTDDTSVIQTKDLESAMVDYSDAVPDPLPDVLMRQWAFMSASGLYDVLTNFTHPVTGDRISLVASEALIYYSYIFMASIQATPEYVPEFVDIKYRLHPRPPVEVLYRDLLKDRFPDLKQIADELVSSQPIMVECFSVSAFFDLTYKVYEECQKHWLLKASTMDPMKRGIVAKMISRLFGITCLKLTSSSIKMDTWLAERSLPVFTGGYQEGMAICKVIFQAATGYTIDDTKSLRSIQKAMIEMFKQLSSYSIQVMREINDSAIVPVNWSAIRVGIDGQAADDDLDIEAGIRVLDYESELKMDVDVLDAGDYVHVDSMGSNLNVSIRADVSVKLCSGEFNTVFMNSIEVPSIRIHEDQQDRLKVLEPFLPGTYYDALTPEQVLQIAKQVTTQP